MRYFISYYNLVNNSDLKKDINTNTKELKIVSKSENNYTINSIEKVVKEIANFDSYIDNVGLDKFIKLVEKERDNIEFMIELSSEEANKIHPVFLKRFKDNEFINNDKKIKLLEKDVVDLMNTKEFTSGRFIYLNKSDDESYELSINPKNETDYSIGEGKYFYTEIDRTVEKYEDKVLEIELTSKNKYMLKRHRMLVIDSVGRDRLIGLSREAYTFYYRECLNDKIIYIKEYEEKSFIYPNLIPNSKKGFIIENENIDTLLHNSFIEPLFKYINIYELVDGVYKKTSLQEYVKNNRYYVKTPNN